ncbi:MAG: biotin/lipoyl-binding protein, partial [Ginsengibacter sp.]
MSLNSSRSHFFLLLFISAVAMFSCEQKAPKAKRGDDGPVIVDVIIATPQKINNNIEANGTVVANENVDLHPEVSGRLTYLNIPEGKYITKGTVLARVNSADLEAQYQK